MARTTKSLTEAISTSLNGSGGFDLKSFKKSKYLDKSVKFKDEKFIPFSKAFQNIVSLPGAPMGHITLLRGQSDTGKTTLLLETAISAQKMGILPIFIITEMKWSWEHAKQMGFEINEIKDETGKIIDYEGFFLYVDRSSLLTIEDVSAFIADLLNEQMLGKLPYDLLFMWDSIGSIPCRMSVDNNNNNPMWNAGAMANQFGNFINQKFTLSRKETSKYTNTLICVNKTGVQPAENQYAQPKMTNKGGNAMFYDASLVITFGNVTNSGTSKLKATKDGKDVEFAKRTKVACDKNHINGIQTKGSVIMTVHGFIEDDDKSVKQYKQEHKNEWLAVLGSSDFEITEDKSEWDENYKSIEAITIEDEQI